MVLVVNSGQKEANIMASGLIILLKALENLLMQMATFMKEIGIRTRLRVWEHIPTQMELSMLVNGMKISNMVKAKKPGLMVPLMKESIRKVKK